MEATSVKYSARDMEDIAKHAAELLAGMSSIVEAAQGMTHTLSTYRVASIQEQWAETWGETVNKTTAAKMLGVSPSQVTNLIKKGILQVTPDNRVLVRAAAEWANGGRAEAARKNKNRKTQFKFIP